MRFSYGGQLGWLKPSRKQLAIALGLFVLPAAASVSQVAGQAEPAVSRPSVNNAVGEKGRDPRVDLLSRFFSRLHCPVRTLAADFVAAADENQIDWRLLPSISVVESGGGKVYRNNNIFGWNNGNVLFSSIRHSIHEIAFALGRGARYRRQDTVGKLRIYNSDSVYVESVLEVMRRISPTANLPARQNF